MTVRVFSDNTHMWRRFEKVETEVNDHKSHHLSHLIAADSTLRELLCSFLPKLLPPILHTDSTAQ